jgi:MFS family permease
MLSVNIAPSSKSTSSASSPLVASGVLIPFALVTALFFLWGIPNNLNDILIRQFMKSFAITRLQAGLVQSAFYMGYFLLALPSALYMRRVGYKAGFITGLILFGLGTFLFWPAAMVGLPRNRRAPAELFASLQSHRIHRRRPDRDRLHLFRRGVERRGGGQTAGQPSV